MANKVVLITVFVFDVIAFALAVTAEQRRSTASVVADKEKDYSYCVYDSDIATGLGVGAFLFLMVSQVVIMVATRCFCCAEACLLAGLVRNAYHTKYRMIFMDQPPTCETLRKGVFGAGAAFIFFTTIISEFYYISYAKSRGDSGGEYPPFGKESGVRMGTY
ncbi:hypothetical protein QJS10_CPA09g01568 [Acorus calamus]|uniref:Fiber protein Fb34 n=1 Tax=Acorus calamus TaxID=4465 RepID=A0AAV9E6C0_ACOCL|nr:hypothetical protein QJS10_CPA09g01568 [Acorus calamus]